MNANFDLLPWHDAELLELTIDRRNAGECDEVQMHIRWPQGNENVLVFRDCYAMTAEMNFGIIATERVGSATLVFDDPDLDTIRSRWRPLGVSLDSLLCYRFEMSSTGSVIRVFSKRFSVK